MWARYTLVGLLLSAAGCGLSLDLDPPDVPPPPTPRELCNGIDDDGDAVIDEDPTDRTLGDACFDGPSATRGVGICVEGLTTCEDGALRCVGSGRAREEICNGLDDDCDGEVLLEGGEADCNAVVIPGPTQVRVEVAPPTIDLHFNLDTTGSMGAVIDTLRVELMSFIVPGVQALFPDAAFGVSTFDDFPTPPRGTTDIDLPYELHQRITTDVASTRRALEPLVSEGGLDEPESGIEALFQLATGEGRVWADTTQVTSGVIPRTECTVGFDPAAGHGLGGGACFRQGALPVIVHFTDAASHEGSDYEFEAAGSDETFAALRTLGARVIGIWSGFASIDTQDPSDLLLPLGMSLATDTTVPICAFDDHPARRDGTCPAGMCCTGARGAGLPPHEGVCPLTFDVSREAVGLEESIVLAIGGLTRHATFDLSVELIDIENDGVDARCFVQSVEISALTPRPDDTCGSMPLAMDTDGDGLVDTVENATPETRVSFQLETDNVDSRDVDGDGDVTEPCAETGTYPLEVRILPPGSAAVDAHELMITVP